MLSTMEWTLPTFQASVRITIREIRALICQTNACPCDLVVLKIMAINNGMLFNCSFADIPLSSELHTLNLHCNQISRIERLGHLSNLQHLDLSSNCIQRIEGLSALANLRTLNLSCNLITKVEG